MNLLRLKYILKSEFVFFIIIFILSNLIDIISHFLGFKLEFNLINNFFFSFFLSCYFSLILSINKNIIIKFIKTENKGFSKMNFSVFYVLSHIIFIYIVNYITHKKFAIDNIQLIYLVILIVILIITNILFKFNEKKQLIP